MSGHLYLLRSGSSNDYKIGLTKDLDEHVSKRRKGLATGNPEILHKIKTWHVDSNLSGFEVFVHAHFTPYRIFGRESKEFFKILDLSDDEISRKIDNLHREWLDNYSEPNSKEIEQTSDDVVDALPEHSSLVHRYHELAATIKLAQMEQTVVANQMKSFIAEKAGMKGDFGKITWKTIESNRVDSKALEQHFPEIYKKVTKPTKYRRLFVL